VKKFRDSLPGSRIGAIERRRDLFQEHVTDATPRNSWRDVAQTGKSLPE